MRTTTATITRTTASRQVVGYTFAAETYCPTHTVAALPTGAGEVYDGWALAEDAVILSPEDTLDEIAWAFGIDRREEASFDSAHFPKVLLAQDVISPEDAEALADGTYPTSCAACQESLAE